MGREGCGNEKDKHLIERGDLSYLPLFLSYFLLSVFLFSVLFFNIIVFVSLSLSLSE